MKARIRQIWHVALLLALQLLILQAQELTESPEKLAARIVDDSCKADNFTSFYLQIRDSHEVARKYPVWPNEDTGLAGVELLWNTVEPFESLIPSYQSFWSDAFYLSSVSTIKPEDYTWCIYVFTREGTNSVYGCIRNGEVWSSPEFRALGLLDKMSTREASADLGLPFPLVELNIDAISALSTGNMLWHNAMLTLNLDWQDPTGVVSSVGEYFIISVQNRRAQYITDITNQAESFLVEGALNQFSCEVYGGYRLLYTTWLVKDSNDSVSRVINPCEHDGQCGDILFFNDFSADGIENCNRASEALLLATNHLTLVFSNASRDDTGEYVCAIYGREQEQQVQARSIFISVVFTEQFEAALPYQHEGELRCAAKAPTGSTISVWHNGDRISTRPSPRSAAACDDSLMISTSSEILDGQFSMFYATVHICQVSAGNIGKYACHIEYSIPTETIPQIAQIATEVTLFEPEDAEGPDSGLSTGQGVAVACATFFLAVVLIMTVAIALFLAVVKLSRCRARRNRARQHINFKISPINLLYHKVGSVSPGSMSTHCGSPEEFSRSNLELHKHIGKGRFGKVMLATARNIIPHLPTLNKVAVKMASTSASNDVILAELKVMKKLESHENICNLLAYCTIGGPVYVIMEYAEGGNLKEYLDSCRQSLRQAGHPLAITKTTPYYDPFGANLKAGDAEERVPVRVISEPDIRGYASQIISGLEHLHNMQIVHSDLAARNILISEGFVLKIGDFGMARSVAMEGEDDSNHSADDMDGLVAIKWAAIEVLQNKGCFIKSDIWSYAVVIWEIASYGARPFSEHKVGASLSTFAGYLQAGHHLPQPDGLSNSIYKTLLSCWSLEPSLRPSSSDLKDYFQDK